MKKMKTTKTLIATSVLFLMLTVISSCNRVPITGRKQVSLLPESELTAMSLVEYNNFLNANQVVNSGTNSAMVTRVGEKIARSVEDVLRNSGNADLLEHFDWEFHLVESPEPNAWCMPGGKVVVYTGILPYTKDEDGLAVVMGHEVAHAVARHGNERMSQQLLASTGFAALDIAMANKPEQTRELILLAAGVGVSTGALLPFSRLQESEADRLGLIFMTIAGYDPEAAVAFWQRMSVNGSGLPEFLSTHPSHETRITDIENEYIPEARTYANTSN
jgi:predicted Zn-dependent protease